MSDQADPRLLERARKARTRYRDLYWVRLPLIAPLKVKGEGEAVHLKEEYDFLFRPLTKNEFEQFSNDAAYGDITDSVIRAALLFPRTRKWSKNPIQRIAPGDYEGLRDMVLEISGFGSKQALYQGLSFGRSEMSNVYGAMAAFICKAFPSMEPHQVENMPWLEQARLLAMAEISAGAPFPLEDLLGQKTRERVSRPPTDFGELPTYTPDQVEAMRRSDAMHQSMVAIAQAREEARQSGLGERRRAEKLDQLAQERLMEEAQRLRNA